MKAKRKRKRIVWIIAATAGTALAALLATGFYYICVMKKTLEEVTTHEGTARTVLSVYVLEKGQRSYACRTLPDIPTVSAPLLILRLRTGFS